MTAKDSSTKRYFSPDETRSIRFRVGRACGSVDACLRKRAKSSAGWQLAPYDPNLALKGCEHLRLKSGYKLASYQLFAGENGNGLTLVIPSDQSLPEPCEDDFIMGWNGPIPIIRLAGGSSPEWIRADIGNFLGGDGSAESYLEASFLLRDLRELGAMWHGCEWSEHRLQMEEPPPYETPKECLPEGVKVEPIPWKLEPIEDWRPCVEISTEGASVTFYTYCQLGYEHITRHVDRFPPGSYEFETTRICCGEGGPGYVH